jgi:hypothetical protein
MVPNNTRLGFSGKIKTEFESNKIFQYRIDGSLRFSYCLKDSPNGQRIIGLSVSGLNPDTSLTDQYAQQRGDVVNAHAKPMPPPASS